VPTSRSTLVLATVVAVIKPLVRLLLRHGVAYPAFVAALKPVFLAAARDELAGRGMVQTDSALSLLSGVHRRDVRTLLRGPGAVDTISSGPARAPAGALERTAPAGEPSGTDHEPPRTVPDEPPRTVPEAPRPALCLAGEVVARWLGDPRYLGADDQPRALSRGQSPAGFDALVQAISSDVRPRAVLDELLRLGVAEFDETGAQVRLRAAGFAPRQGFEVAWLMRANLRPPRGLPIDRTATSSSSRSRRRSRRRRRSSGRPGLAPGVSHGHARGTVTFRPRCRPCRSGTAHAARPLRRLLLRHPPRGLP
jgi:hypothetical protein